MSFYKTTSNLEALVRVSPVLQSRIIQSRRMPFFPDAHTQVSTWTTSPLQDGNQFNPSISKYSKEVYE